MSNIGLIIGHEYTSRVLTKSFIISTLLTPVIMIITMLVPAWLMTREDNTKKEIVVIDESGLYGNVFTTNETYSFVYPDKSINEAREDYSNATGFIRISGDLTGDGTVTLYSEKQLPSEIVSYLRHQINKRVEQQKIEASGIDNLKQIMNEMKTDIAITTVKFSEDGKEEMTSAEFAEIMGLITAMLIYMFILIYGSMVMRSVVQEKSNRIMEVMVASTKPFDLMMGKIIAVALVGLTQFLIWVLLTSIGAAVILPSFVPDNVDMMNAAANLPENGPMAEVMSAIAGFNFLKIILLFIVYFIGGYLLYSALFAAIGSAVDNETDTQQLATPITIVMLVAMYAGIYAAQHPYTDITFWCSLIPFTSPVVMIVRLAYDAAWWEIILSLVILAVSFIGTTWLAAKIYRVGILMYGKKPSWKELLKWIRAN